MYGRGYSGLGDFGANFELKGISNFFFALDTGGRNVENKLGEHSARGAQGIRCTVVMGGRGRNGVDVSR